MRIPRRLWPILSLFVLAGCGDSDFLKVYPASGQIMLDGKPLAGAAVVLHPKDPALKRERPFADTDADGRFKLSTYNVGDGAPAGEFTLAVAIVAKDDSGDDQVKKVKNPVPAKYGKAETSGLPVTIKSGSNVIPTIQLSSKP